jgi:UDP-3-O-[3-hydroxymyristoyl] glucosamine N-acyltransferase
MDIIINCANNFNFDKTVFYMQLKETTTANQIASLINAQLIGNKNAIINGINEINRVEQNDLVFVDHPKYYDKCINSAASVIIINKEVPCPDGKALLVVDQPFEAYDKVVRNYRKYEMSKTAIHHSAIISDTAHIFPNVVIGAHVTIGDGCVIYPNVTIYDYTNIGNNVTIHANTTIGSDAFYYNGKKNRELWYAKMFNCGNVEIKDEVEIGAGCTIDKGVSSSTIIGRGTKIDNQCHIAHDVVIGNNCLIAAQVGIAGATTLEDGVTVWAQTGINKTLTIGANATILARSGVAGNTAGDKTYWGSPIQDVRTAQKEIVWIKRIPEIWEKLNSKK